MPTFSAKGLVRALLLAGAGIGLGLAAGAQADVVVASSGPSASQYPVGKKLAPTDRITLKDNDQVTVLGAGGTRVIKGAGVHRVGAQSTSNRSAYNVLTRQSSARRSRTGAVRSGGPVEPVQRPNMWYVDVAQGGTVCVPDFADVTLWRAGSEGTPTYMVTRQGSSAHTPLTFGEAETTADWDVAQMPLTDGATYTIAGPDGGPVKDVTFVLLQTPPNNPEDMAAALIDKGCTGQLDLLATTLLTAN